MPQEYILESYEEGGIGYQIMWEPEDTIDYTQFFDNPKDIEKIEESLTNGDMFAFWCLGVRAVKAGVEATVYLGACTGNYEEYYKGDSQLQEMKETARLELIKKLQGAAQAYLELTGEEADEQ